jgi:hypothetical protein
VHVFRITGKKLSSTCFPANTNFLGQIGPNLLILDRLRKGHTVDKEQKKKIEGNRDGESLTKLSLPRHTRITRVSRKTGKTGL